MSESKTHPFRPPLYHRDSPRGRSGQKAQADSQARLSEQKGWDAYRRWLSTVGGKRTTERAPVDSSIYSWKGYQNWADRVKQTWKPEDN
jgi:hypothetical protein